MIQLDSLRVDPEYLQIKWINGIGQPGWKTGWYLIPYGTMRASVMESQMVAVGHMYSKFRVKNFGFGLSHLIPLQYTVSSGTNLQLSTTPTTLPYCYYFCDIGNQMPPACGSPDAAHSITWKVGYSSQRNENELPEYEILDECMPFPTSGTTIGALMFKKTL